MRGYKRDIQTDYINGKTATLGVVTDSAQEAVDLKPEQLEPATSLGSAVNNEFISTWEN